ncbi:MAG: hypothetical protein H6Q64_2461 [Firmicutes bacterium]|nr:hypothetical protein [Bacillota bacterium]
MKKKINQLLTFLLAGIMLLGTAGMASAATDSSSTDSTTTPVVSSAPAVPGSPGAAPGTAIQNQKPVKPDPSKVLKKVIPVRISSYSYSELSSILSGLVDDGTLTLKQKRAILKGFYSTGHITRSQLYSRLSNLVDKGTLSKAKMKLVLSCLPTQNYTQIGMSRLNDSTAPVYHFQPKVIN